MTLKEKLLEFLPSNEIKVRVGNRQLKLNGSPVTQEDLLKDYNFGEFQELGDFVYQNLNRLPDGVVRKILPIRDFFGEEQTNLPSLTWLQDYNLLTLSKKEEYLFTTKPLVVKTTAPAKVVTTTSKISLKQFIHR